MKAITFHGKEKLEVETVPDPQILASTDAIVRVRLASICGSDLHPYHEREKGLDLGTVMGHEGVGEIVALGRDFRGLRVGDSVMTPFTTSCGSCLACREGLTCRCERSQLFGWRQNGDGLHGWQAELVRVPMASSTLAKIPDDLSDEKALLLGDVFSTGYFCANMASIKPRGVYVVVGCGPVGLMAILGAKHLGAETLYAVDTLPERLALAETFGAKPLFVDDKSIKDIRADGVMEAVGSPAAQRLAYELLRPGGTLAVAGVHCESTFAFSPSEAYDKNLTYRVGRCPARFYMDELLPLARELPIEKMISHKLPLEDAPRGYRVFDLKEDRCTKIVLTC